jgi:hypothetical protein
MPDGFSIDIPAGTSRQSAYRIALSAMDDFYARGPVPGLHESSEAVDKDEHGSTVASVGTELSEGNPDSEPGREAGDTGESDAPTAPAGEAVDGGTGPDPDQPPVEAGDVDVEQASAERADEESGARDSEHEHPTFYFAAGEAVRGA